MSDATATGPDAGDEQATAEAIDEDELEATADDYPPDAALASLEAAQPLPNGEVPPDSVAERSWREEPEVTEVAPAAVQLIEPHPDAGLDPDFAEEAAAGMPMTGSDDGELDATATPPSAAPVPAEESAVHIVEP